MSYEQPGRLVMKAGAYTVVEEHAGGRKYSVWGPDYAGRICRMSRHYFKPDACMAAKLNHEAGPMRPLKGAA